MGFLHHLRRDERGITGIEYGLLASLLAMAMMGAVDWLGEEVEHMFGHVDSEVDAVMN